MPKLPKLKLKIPEGYDEYYEGIHEFEEAKDFLSNWGAMFIVDGQVINSHEELIKLATRDQYKDKEFLEVMVIPFIEGG